MVQHEIVYDPIRRQFDDVVFITSAGDYRWTYFDKDEMNKINQDLSVWIDFIGKDKKLNSNKVCHEALGKIKHTFDHSWRTNSNDKSAEISRWTKAFDDILSVIETLSNYDEPRQKSYAARDINVTVYAENLNISIHQVNDLILEIERLEISNHIQIDNELRKAILDYRSNTNDQSKVRNLLTKLKTGVTASGPYVGLVNALLGIIGSV